MKARRINPLRIDPTRTTGLRRTMTADLKRKFNRFRMRLVQLIADEDALGLKARPLFNEAELDEWVANCGGPGSGIPGPCAENKGKIAKLREKVVHAAQIAKAVGIRVMQDVITTLGTGGAEAVLPVAQDFAKITFAKPDPIAAAIGIGTNDLLPIASKMLAWCYTKARVKLGFTANAEPDEVDAVLKLVRLIHEMLGYPDADLPSREEVEARLDLTANKRWQFQADPAKVKQFQEWVKVQLKLELIGISDEQLWDKYIKAGYTKGAGRAFEDVKGPAKDLGPAKNLDFYAGSKDQFLQTAFGRPVSADKVKLLAARAFDDLKGVTDAMSTKLSRGLVDGLVQGWSPRDIAKALAEEVDISSGRALTIARTEIVRAHAEGQLQAMDLLGVEEVGVAVEWSTAGDDAVCEDCAYLEGVVLKLEEAAGMLPRHPNCRCAWIPAGVGEDAEGQKATKPAIDAAFAKSGLEDTVSKDRPVGNALLRFSTLLHNCGGPGSGIPGPCAVGGKGGGGKGKPAAPKLSATAERAKANHKMVDKGIQRYAEEHNEPAMAKALGGTSLPNGEPIDVAIPGPGGTPAHGVELKTMVDNTRNKIDMNTYAQVRKIEWERENGATFHTVVLDDQKVYNANGEGKHDPSQRRMFYRRGVGSFRVEGMHEITGGMKELKELMAKGDKDLPPAAQRTDGANRVGKWKPFVDKEGKGFKNSTTGRIVRPKK